MIIYQILNYKTNEHKEEREKNIEIKIDDILQFHQILIYHLYPI